MDPIPDEGRPPRHLLGLRQAAVNALCATRLGRRAFLGRYRYAFTPQQLWAICEAATESRSIDGAFAEIGVAIGDTTLYLHRHLATLGPLPDYVCLDTFSGFTDADIAEERRRGKTEDYDSWFRLTSRQLFEQAMTVNGLDGTVTTIEADAAAFDYSRMPALSFALVDVDLYRPMRSALEGCWSRLLPGGILIADDCQPVEQIWDGARQAYSEFCDANALPIDVRHEKLGFARKDV